MTWQTGPTYPGSRDSEFRITEGEENGPWQTLSTGCNPAASDNPVAGLVNGYHPCQLNEWTLHIPWTQDNLTWCSASSWFINSHSETCLLPDSQHTTYDSHQAWWDLDLSGLSGWYSYLLGRLHLLCGFGPSFHSLLLRGAGLLLKHIRGRGGGEMYYIIMSFSCTETCIMSHLI